MDETKFQTLRWLDSNILALKSSHCLHSDQLNLILSLPEVVTCSAHSTPIDQITPAAALLCSILVSNILFIETFFVAPILKILISD